jgi:hypothetical protein
LLVVMLHATRTCVHVAAVQVSLISESYQYPWTHFVTKIVKTLSIRVGNVQGRCAASRGVSGLVPVGRSRP